MRTRAPLLIAFLLAPALAAAATSSDTGDADAAHDLLQRARASADAGVPTPQAAPSAATVVDYGHGGERMTSAGYNIWTVNCHTEANLFAAMASALGVTGGVLACQGDPQHSPEFHTASWAVERGQTCVYNYGRPCCWSGTASPPDLSAGEALRCARWACGDQYKPKETRALPPGQLVESPSPAVCTVAAAGGPVSVMPGDAIEAITEHNSTGRTIVRTRPYLGAPDGAALTFTPDRLESCLSCCDSRAALWAPYESQNDAARFPGRESSYLRRCRQSCGAFKTAAPVAASAGGP